MAYTYALGDGTVAGIEELEELLGRADTLFVHVAADGALLPLRP